MLLKDASTGSSRMQKKSHLLANGVSAVASMLNRHHHSPCSTLQKFRLYIAQALVWLRSMENPKLCAKEGFSQPAEHRGRLKRALQQARDRDSQRSLTCCPRQKTKGKSEKRKRERGRHEQK